MKLADLIIEGTVTDVTERSGTNDRGPWSIVTAFLVGARRAYEVTLSDELIGKVAPGDDVALLVYPRVYNGSVTFAATGFADEADRVASRAFAE